MRSLGICWIFYGVWRLLIAGAMILGSGTATVMFGALLTRVPDPYSLMTGFHVVYVGAVILSVVCGLLGVLAGLALMGRGGNSQIGMVAALLSLPDVPVGLILGSYTLYTFARITGRQAEVR